MTEATLGIAEAATADAPPTLRFRGAAKALTDAEQRQLFDRSLSVDEGVARRTGEIIARVRAYGDQALFALARELDGVDLDSLEIPRRTIRAALDRIAPPLRRALERSMSNTASVHRAFLPAATETSPEPGIIVGGVRTRCSASACMRRAGEPRIRAAC